MTLRHSFVRGMAAGLTALAAILACPAASHAGVQLAILPATQTVAPGTDFDVTVQVTGAGPQFNGFFLPVTYDPAALTPVTLSPISGQLGSLVTTSCGNRFHTFSASLGVDSANVALLCAGASMTGPGTIYRLRFHASSTVQTTSLGFLPAMKFSDGGINVAVSTATNAAVGIGMAATLGVGDGPPPAALSLAASPNPARGDVTFAFGAPLATGASLRVSDVQGRTVRVFVVPAGARSVTWDARGANGEAMGPGLYLAELRRGARRDVVRVTLVR